MKVDRATRKAAELGVVFFLAAAVAQLGALLSGCGRKKCTTDADCPKNTACLQGKCVSLTGGPKPKGPNPFERRRPGKPDPGSVYRVDVDAKKHPTKGPADALVTLVEFSEFQ